MGAWGIGALENDKALDWMDGRKSIPVEGVRRLLDSWDEQEQFLGVCLVDSALNGTNRDIVGSFYEYEELLNGLKDNKYLIGLTSKAKKVINALVKDGASTWVSSCKDDRLNLLKMVKDRLKGV